MSVRTRLDVALVERGLTESRSRAQALILAGGVSVSGRVAKKAGEPVGPNDEIVVAQEQPYVSRGGLKLAHALDRFQVSPLGAICLDSGASTGGFTDVLLQRGAERVYAVDVGYGQLAWRLRQDERVVVRERTNLRYLRRGDLADPISLCTLDLSFISLRLVLPAVEELGSDACEVVALVKPQFEAGQKDVGKGGIVRDRAVHLRVLEDVIGYAPQSGLHIQAACASPILGQSGNREFLVHLGRRAPQEVDVASVVEEAWSL